MTSRVPRLATSLVKRSSHATLPRCQCSISQTKHTTTLYHPSRRRNQSSWAATVNVAQQVFRPPPPDPKAPLAMDPFQTVAKELKFLTGNIKQLLGSGHPTLDTVSKYYTQSEGKYVRPMLVLLMSRATALIPKTPRESSPFSINKPFTTPGVLSDENPSAPDAEYPSVTSIAQDTAYQTGDPDILPSQRRLAEITELIHTASLLHDDVIDHSVSRRSAPSANIEFGNKMAVLAGDFLLGRASVYLARLRDPEVTELLATVIANLVEGEFMQLKNTASDERNPVWTENTLTYYLQKTYLKSASLISKSCRAAAILGGSAPEVVEASYQYGKNLGLAFQLVDDMLDYTISGEELGKPAGADLELGLATAPLLFAWKDNKSLGKLVGRKFSEAGDVQKARDIVSESTGLEQTRALAQEYVDKAIQSIASFPESDAKNGLIEMCTKVMQRRK
ncbi:geranylgeranyl pyrophosphate synthetase [Bimuria novae-zelandiae CBS 107.79]|uniref:geranylgeranyl diphosphate synthase n=1 Tax=Bimuria novae-zelandiae CBS 107.79 TaxID=1447943 RepID=A0A6A5VE83_9PLEO|nr:geranylgeranyl pyrophosphate synthetase [Bimuria novae-zelandiae CBS 107.79]